jgi:hypothetical protein
MQYRSRKEKKKTIEIREPQMRAIRLRVKPTSCKAEAAIVLVPRMHHRRLRMLTPYATRRTTNHTREKAVKAANVRTVHVKLES